MFVIKLKDRDLYLCRKPELKLVDIDSCQTYRSVIAAKTALSSNHPWRIDDLKDFGVTSFDQFEIREVTLTLK